MGPSLVVIVDSVPYFFDAGTGIVRRAVAASRADARLSPVCRTCSVFRICVGSHAWTRRLLLTPWVQGAKFRSRCTGRATKRLVNDIIDGNDEDIREQARCLERPRGERMEGERSRDFEGGGVQGFARDGARVRGLLASWKCRYRVWGRTGRSSSAVIRARSAIAAACNGCDVLIRRVLGFRLQGDSAPAGRFITRRRIPSGDTTPGAIATNAKAEAADSHAHFVFRCERGSAVVGGPQDIQG